MNSPLSTFSLLPVAFTLLSTQGHALSQTLLQEIPGAVDFAEFGTRAQTIDTGSADMLAVSAGQNGSGAVGNYVEVFSTTGGTLSTFVQTQSFRRGYGFAMSLAFESGQLIGLVSAPFTGFSITCSGLGEVFDLGGTQIDVGAACGDNLGLGVALADLDGDGLMDQVYGVPRGNQGTGELRVLPTGGSSPYIIMDPAAPLTGRDFGSSLTSLGDIDGDGADDLLVTARGADVAYVYSGSQTTPSQTITSSITSGFGSNCGRIGDVNGDGSAEFWISGTSSATGFGVIEVFDGANFTQLYAIFGTGADPFWIGFPFGSVVGSGGDFDGDGINDLIVGDTPLGPLARIYDGANGGLLATVPRDASATTPTTSVSLLDIDSTLQSAGRAEVAVGEAFFSSPGMTLNGRLRTYDFVGGIGSPYCVPDQATNPTAAECSASGSLLATANSVTLTMTGMQNGSFGAFLVSTSTASVVNPQGSLGTLCLGAGIGRYVGPGQVQNAFNTGQISLMIDLTNTPRPTGNATIMPGETWYFQGWHRVVDQGVQNTNFTNGLEMTFQ